MNNPDKPTEHAGNPDDAPNPSFVPRAWAFIVEPKHSYALVAIFTVLIFFTGLVFTSVSTYQAFQMQQALNLTRSDQRAWIKVDYPGFESPSVPITVKFTNVGKSPALRLGASTVVEVVKSQNEPAFLAVPKRHSGMYVGLIFPTEQDRKSTRL